MMLIIVLSARSNPVRSPLAGSGMTLVKAVKASTTTKARTDSRTATTIPVSSRTPKMRHHAPRTSVHERRMAVLIVPPSRTSTGIDRASATATKMPPRTNPANPIRASSGTTIDSPVRLASRGRTRRSASPIRTLLPSVNSPTTTLSVPASAPPVTKMMIAFAAARRNMTPVGPR